ncbi:MAG: CbiX/SirB N-terminal domain-containing protein [Burkholderiales bacterium]|jgi:sirohydrochlorin cobaltochelatase|nr:CbiX/SirB N-terminal domain-containing protein [Burkholderiales bacterium]
MTASTARADGLILFGHGSRDAGWHAPMQAVARRVAELEPGLQVICAYLELTSPDLPTAAATLAAGGVRTIRVLPLFLGMGRHAREDLPGLVESVRSQWPDIRFDLRPAVGTDRRVTDLLAALALE